MALAKQDNPDLIVVCVEAQPTNGYMLCTRLKKDDRLKQIPVIELHHLETHTTATNLGAKGLGEGGAIGAPAAVVNAINDALSPFGISIDEMPATPQRIRAALRAKEGRK